MVNIVRKPIENEDKTSKGLMHLDLRHPLENLRKQVDQLFEDFHFGGFRRPFARTPFDAEPVWRRELLGHGMPAVDITEKDKCFELSAELPGMDEQNIEIKLSDSNLLIRGEKREQSESKRKDYYLSERHYGAFERIFNLPKGIDAEHIEARFHKGILTITLPKKPEAIKPEKVIPIKNS